MAKDTLHLQTIRAFLGPMMDRNEGQIVGVSSIAGFYGETYGAAYWYENSNRKPVLLLKYCLTLARRSLRCAE
jgi:NAD(P)-dependent dehydrogenase (short-subunit alcohol dehydrogenase family)